MFKAVERAIIMVIRYLWAILVVLTGIRFNNLKPLYSPCYGEFTEGIAKDPRNPKNCWLLYDKNGKRRGFWFPEMLLSPALWFVIIFKAIDTGDYLSVGENVLTIVFYYYLIKTVVFFTIIIEKYFTKGQGQKTEV